MAYKNSSTGNIVSRFYVIEVDEKAVYVGFTNRSLKQRFREHKEEKELPDNATIREVDKLEFPFTWDVGAVYANANTVSAREAELVDEYGTQGSVYQKALGGGVVWAEIKHFVRTNKGNPKFMGLDENVILHYIAITAERGQRLESVIRTTKQGQRLGSVINNTKQSRRLESVIQDTKQSRRLESVINNTKQGQRLENVICDTKQGQRLGSVIRDTKQSKRLENVINNTKQSKRLESVIRDTKQGQRLENVINNTKQH